MPISPNGRHRWQELTLLLDRADRRGFEALTVDDVKRLGQLYRHVTIDLSRARTDGDDPELMQYLNLLAARAHGCIYRSRRVDIRPLFTFVASGFPRLVASYPRLDGYILVNRAGLLYCRGPAAGTGLFAL
jgi:hypothetical protein